MERHDLYTFDRQKTGETMVRGEAQPQGRWRMIVHVCYFNDQGKMLIQHRQPFKNGWADRWDLSVGGSSVSGEASWEAAARETREELGLDLSFDGCAPRLTFNSGRVFDDIYIRHDPVDLSALTLQAAEVAEVRWASLDEIKELIRREQFVAYPESLLEFLFFTSSHRDITTHSDRTVPTKKN